MRDRVSMEAGDPPAVGRAASAPPALSPQEYAARLDALRRVLAERGHAYAVIYGDREHGANLEFLTGFDPRFEEALLVVRHDGPPALLVGNEGLQYAQVVPVDVEVHNVREFSLTGQPLKDSRPLDAVLGALGLQGGERIGVTGWKTTGGRIDVPHYIVRALETVAGATVESLTDAFTDAGAGLRVASSAAQLAQFEFAATECSESLLEGLLAVSEGATEYDLVRAMRLPGIPLSVHPMVMSGERTRLGLASPSDRRLARGEPLMMALGMRGGLNARAGVIDAWRPGADGGEYLERLVRPYFAAVRTWWSSLRIGAIGGEIHAAVVAAMGTTFTMALNPGHLIHLEEWLDTPFRPGSETALRSGSLIQCDIIPVYDNPAFAMNVEDTVALADEPLRDEIREAHPEMWERIGRRRAYMESTFGIRLAPEVLPFSNLAGYVAPFLLSPGAILTADGERP